MTEGLSQFKYVIFFTIFIVGIPTGYYLASINKNIEKLIFFMMMFFTCKMEDINFISRETYRGSCRGFEIGLVDLVTIIMCMIVLKNRKKFGVKNFPHGSVLYLGYFTFSAISIMNSGVALYSFMELWKMARMYFFFWVIYNYFDSEEKVELFIRYVGIIISYITFTIVNQKYRMGIFQTPGPFPHQNSLVMYILIFNSIVFAYVLNSKSKLWKRYFLLYAMGAFCLVSTLSRAGLALFAMASVIVLGLSFVTKFTVRKVIVSIMLFFGGLLGLYKAADSIIERFETAPEESKLTRINLAIAAVNMAEDKYFGVGLNNFGLKINPPYPYGNHIERANYDDKGGLVETVYLMIAAETGWINLFIFILFLLKTYIINVANYFRLRKTEMVFLPIGVCAGLSAIYLESTLEWVLKQTNNFYQLMLIFAIVERVYHWKK